MGTHENRINGAIKAGETRRARAVRPSVSGATMKQVTIGLSEEKFILFEQLAATLKTSNSVLGRAIIGSALGRYKESGILDVWN